MSRPVRVFKTYADFNASSTPKQSLASLCVTAREILLAYERAETKIKSELLAEHVTAKDAKDNIQRCRDERKVNITQLVKAIYDKRNEGYEMKLPEWTQASDIFMNVSDHGKEDDASEKLVVEYNTLVARLQKTELDLATMTAKWENAENRIANFGDGVINGTNEVVVSGTSVESTPVRVKGSGHYKLDSKTPVFKSKSDEDIETWLFKIETALKFASVPEDMWLIAVTNYVEGTAFEMVMTAIKDKSSWFLLRDLLVKTFRATFKDFNVRSKLLSLRDTGNFEKYLHDFRTLSNQIQKSAMPEADRLTCFMQG